jgi:predicted alpha/beta-hydrolase family hydrolase
LLTASPNVLLLFAPGAGAPSSSAWMVETRARLTRIGPVECFDYPYQREGRRSPDRQPVLVAAHREALEQARARHPGPFVLIGKSMGSRMGCHLSLELTEKPLALVCMGYPLVGQNGAVRDQVLLELETPILFVQGTRDVMCPPERLAEVRKRMHAPNELCSIEGGDHSLQVRKRELSERKTTQAAIDEQIAESIASFVRARS